MPLSRNLTNGVGSLVSLVDNPAHLPKTAQSPPASLSGLPQELVDNVAQFLDLQDISRLSRTSRRLYAQTFEKLYTHITMKWVGDGPRRIDIPNLKPPRNKKTATISCPRVDLLLRTVSENPDLADQISSLELETSRFLQPCQLTLRYMAYDYGPCLPPADDALTSSYKDMVRSLGLEPVFTIPEITVRPDVMTTRRNNWDSALETNDIKAVSSLLIAFCPNLISLTLGAALMFGNDFLPKVLERLIPDEQSHCKLARLEAIVLGKIEENEEFSRHPILDDRDREDFQRIFMYRTANFSRPSDYISLLRCPSLKKLTLGSFTRNFDNYQGSVSVQSIPLKVLRIPDEHISPVELMKILRRTPALERLDYGFWARRKPRFRGVTLPSHYPVVHCKHFMYALNLVRKTLTHLRLGSEMGFRGTWLELAQHGYCPFTYLKSLKVLQTSLNIIFGDCDQQPRRPDHPVPIRVKHFEPSLWSRLPPNIEHWVVSFDGWTSVSHTKWLNVVHITKTFQAVFETYDWRSHTPRLRRLDFETSPHNVDATVQEWEDLRRVCVSAGLECNVLNSVEVDWI